MSKLTVGADPEFFLKDENDKPVSAHDIVPGTKDNPFPLQRGTKVQADGTAVEFNIAPAETAEEFQGNVLDALEQLRQAIPKKLKFNFSPSVFYPKEYFSTLPFNAKELGCSPDFNGLNGKINPTPKPEGKYETLRTAAGHIHLGWGKDMDIFEESHRFDCQHIAYKLDNAYRPYMYLWDKDLVRKVLYGGNAAYRPKPYGVEYRALSVAWLKYPDLYPWIFDTAKHVYDAMSNGVTAPYTLRPQDKMFEKELNI